MKQKLFTLLTLLVLCVTGASADPTYHSITPNIAGSQYEVYYLFNSTANADKTILSAKSTINTAVSSWITGSCYGTGTNTYTSPANWLESDNNGIKARSSNQLVFYVTNCIEVSILGAKNSSNCPRLSVKEAGSDTEVGTILIINETSTTSATYGTPLDKSKNYVVTLDGTAGNAWIYQIRFKSPTVPIKIAANGYSTFCSSSILDLANLPDGLTAYKVEDANVTASSVSLTEVSVAANANTPLILKGTGGETYNIPVAATGNAISDNKLVQGDGTTGGVAWEDGKAKYVLQGGTFKKIAAGTPATVPTTKAYLELDHDVAANELTFDFGDVTAIEKVEAKKVENGVFYNLAGQQVAQPTKGLYIVNGKKVVLK